MTVSTDTVSLSCIHVDNNFAVNEHETIGLDPAVNGMERENNGRIDFYPYPEQAEQIEGLYISGLPDGELPVGVVCYVSYEFSGNAETDGALSYLSMEMEKTEQGWKILSYGLEG